MEANQYRKAALERLSSPEQVDDVLRISTTKDWVAMLAIVLVLVTVGIWSVKGVLPAKAAGRGVLVRRGGLLTVVSPESGLVVAMNVKVGDTVRANQVVARISQPALADRIAATRAELREAEGDRRGAVDLAASHARLQTEAIALMRENAKREIGELVRQAE